VQRAYIALGGNLGDVSAAMSGALRLLEEAGGVIVAVSHIYESEPWGGIDQPQYANAVAAVDTTLSAPDLLGLLKEIESQLGRKPAQPPNSPRSIDLDILLLSDEEWQTDTLTIPHPRMAERDFVITPLLEIAPEVRWPNGEPIMAQDVSVGRVTGIVGDVPGFEDRTPAQPVGTGAGKREDPHPDEPWSSVYEFGTDPTIFGLAASAAGGPSPLMGKRPNVAASFAQMVLEQAEIPYSWDPFPPERTSDPYGFSRHFRLVVPSSMAEEAIRILGEASSAMIDWSDADLGP